MKMIVVMTLASLRGKTVSEWVSVEEFKEINKDLNCDVWIYYKRKVIRCRYDGFSELFRFIPNQGCYMTECISKVMIIVPPEPPKDKP